MKKKYLEKVIQEYENEQIEGLGNGMSVAEARILANKKEAAIHKLRQQELVGHPSKKSNLHLQLKLSICVIIILIGLLVVVFISKIGSDSMDKRSIRGYGGVGYPYNPNK